MEASVVVDRLVLAALLVAEVVIEEQVHGVIDVEVAQVLPLRLRFLVHLGDELRQQRCGLGFTVGTDCSM